MTSLAAQEDRADVDGVVGEDDTEGQVSKVVYMVYVVTVFQHGSSSGEGGLVNICSISCRDIFLHFLGGGVHPMDRKIRYILTPSKLENKSPLIFSTSKRKVQCESFLVASSRHADI